MFRNLNNETGKQALTLRELNLRIKTVMQERFAETYWLRAETSDVRVNYSSGHCYLEFVEKNEKTGQIVAKARGSIWAKTFAMLKPYFEKETGQAFVSGLTVLVKVTVEFHELYGFSLTVYDIDPTYTLGDMARKRLEIVNQLKAEGIFTLNKELPFPVLPQRIAVITSPTAAGYEDFMNQLANNEPGFPFYVKLFSAFMQGDKTEESVISALDRIYACADHFDVVAIIRGGGASSDLSCFDSYLLAANCAQFPLPVLTGIGHERDETVLDMVAHTRLKTPTAVAEFLIAQMKLAADAVKELEERLVYFVDTKLTEQKTLVQLLGSRLPVLALNMLSGHKVSLTDLLGKMQRQTLNMLSGHNTGLTDLLGKVQRQTAQFLSDKQQFLQLTEQFVKMASPDYILKRGYTLTLKDGKILKSASAFKPGETLITRFADGDVEGVVSKINKK